MPYNSANPYFPSAGYNFPKEKNFDPCTYVICIPIIESTKYVSKKFGTFGLLAPNWKISCTIYVCIIYDEIKIGLFRHNVSTEYPFFFGTDS